MSAVEDLFDVWAMSGGVSVLQSIHGHTRDVLVQDQVLVDHIVYQAFTVVVEDKHFPLLVLLFSQCFQTGVSHTHVASSDLPYGMENDYISSAVAHHSSQAHPYSRAELRSRTPL